ncbi:MAG: hypothetical protein LBI18_01470, partial [Planctomycetaceae bacterium]|jgi:hypothetical protein|nr:hypothetical protein [Planctomycetaceae bacterium]
MGHLWERDKNWTIRLIRATVDLKNHVRYFHKLRKKEPYLNLDLIPDSTSVLLSKFKARQYVHLGKRGRQNSSSIHKIGMLKYCQYKTIQLLERL